jgi:cobalamin biosynthesis Mg chelatase CobN
VGCRPSHAVVNHILHSHPTSRLFAALALVIALVVVTPGVAVAKKKPSCGKEVVADWYDDGRVGKIYPLHCYTDAIASLPSDVRDYSSAKEEISRALAYAKLGKPDPGKKGSSNPSGGGATGGGGSSTGKTSTSKTSTGKSSIGTRRSGAIEGDTLPIDTGAVDTAAATPTDTSGPSSVPIPLIVLGSLAVILLAAGSAGYLRRRATSGDDDSTPPASS